MTNETTPITDADYQPVPEKHFSLDDEIRKHMNIEIPPSIWEFDRAAAFVRAIIIRVLEHEEALTYMIYELDLLDDIDKAKMASAVSQGAYWGLTKNRKYITNDINSNFQMGRLITDAAAAMLTRRIETIMDDQDWRADR